MTIAPASATEVVLAAWGDLLACPRCHGTLIARDEALHCPQCDELLRIDRGVLVAIDHASLSPHLASQIATFERERAIRDDTYELAPWQGRYLERWLDACGSVTPAMAALDCGTGSGYMAIELARRGARVLACDLTLASLHRLARIAEREGLADRVLTICCAADRLPVRNEAVQAFVANALLEHVPDEPATIREWTRVTEAGSTLMVAVPVRFRLVHPLLVAVQWWRDRQVGHLRRYDLDSLRRVFADWSLQHATYTGHWSKAWRVLANLTGIAHYDEEAMERLDAAHEASPRWSSNLITFWRRNP